MLRLFHVSEDGQIGIFFPKSSPSLFPSVSGNLVFAISEKLLHNYLLPRECPRVTYYKSEDSTPDDIQRFFGQSRARFIMVLEENWIDRIRNAVIYCYEFPVESFSLLDEVAGYYISYEPVVPIALTRIVNPLEEIRNRKEVEIRFLPDLNGLAAEISTSSLNYSLIRMRNAGSVS